MAFDQNNLSQGFDELPVASLVDNMYRIVRLIGRGGMGAVYEAEDIRLGRSVALKVLRSDLARQLQADERFLQEARILARIRSPFVATVYSIGATEGGRTYIAMEYIDGESLGDLLDRERWLPTPRAVKLTQRVAEALVEAHDHGIVHRDLKPDNILLTRIGSVEDYVKVVDLGLAKHIQSAGTSSNPRLTQARLVLGTPAYMAPEQAAGDDVGPSSDLYALGVIFYEMLTGYLPVDGETPQDFLRAHQLQQATALAERRPDLRFPPELEEFCQRVLSKNPEDRPKNARDFLKDIERFERTTVEASSFRPTPQPAAAAPRRNSAVVAPTLQVLQDRLDRAKDRVRLELVGLVSRSRGMLYETFDLFTDELKTRPDTPLVVRVRVPPAESRQPLGCLFEEVRVRAGMYDDDPPSVARRKLLAYVQALMPDRPGRASQVAHLLGMFLNVNFPDSPHLSHARAVPEVARMAAGNALADVLRAITGRGSLVMIYERAEFLTESECAFLRRLVRQLGATPVLVIAGWACATDDVPRGLTGMIAPGAITRVPGKDSAALESISDPELRRVLAASVRLGSPLWPGLLEAALGYPVEDELQRLAEAGALRRDDVSRLSAEREYNLGDFPEQLVDEARRLSLDLTGTLRWLKVHASSRPGAWSRRLALFEAQVPDLESAVGHCCDAARDMRTIGALPEAIESFERARGYCQTLIDQGRTRSGAVGLCHAAIGLSECLALREDMERSSDRAREAIDELRGLPDLAERDWYTLGVPLLVAWARAEVAAGRAKGAIDPLMQQIDAVARLRSELTVAHLPQLRMSLGEALHARGQTSEALQSWLAAVNDLPPEPDFSLVADLAMRIADAYRTLGDGDRAVSHARKALAAARNGRDLVRETEALRALALALRDIGELDDAEAQLGEALNALGRVDRPKLAAEISVLLASVLMQRGAIDEADAALAKACRSFAALTDLAGLSDALRQRGEIQMAQGIYTRALAFAEESVRQAELAEETRLQVRALLLATRAGAASSDSGDAHASLERAFSLVPHNAATNERGECMVTLADLLEAQILTSDRGVGSLLEEAREIYRACGNDQQVLEITRRLKAMARSASSGLR